MGIAGGPNILGDENLVFIYDIADTDNCYLGRPTTNILANAGLSTYNNASGNVTSNLSATSETYRGATVWRQDLTALDSSGASYLSNANNPGIGVVTSGGGGTANTYTGHSIFFKPTVPMSSSPIFTSYSNIGGWQSSNLYESMGDGWFRAYVLWYDTVTRSDGKYWAINPLSTTIGQTVTIYWAGPFREDLNSTFISPFVNGTRSISGSLFDLSRFRNTTTLTNSYTSTGQITFDGTDDFINVGNLGTIGNTYSIECVFNSSDIVSYRNVCDMNYNTYNPNTGNVGPRLEQVTGNTIYWIWSGNTTNNNLYNFTSAASIAPNKYYHTVFTLNNGTVNTYLNGVISNSNAASAQGYVTSFGDLKIGRGFVLDPSRYFSGQIPIFKIYNKALSASEVYNNYIIQKARFGL
jgi:hypothetical protein